MKKKRNKTLCFFIFATGLFLFSVSPAHPAPIIIDNHDQFDFALTLMERGEYMRAIGEFERFIHFFPNDLQVPKARLLTGICYLKARRYENARDIFSRIIRSKQDTLFSAKALFLMGESYYQQGILKEAEAYFNKLIETHPDSDLKSAALYRLGWASMKADRWRDASEIFSKVEMDSLLYESSRQLAAQSLEGEKLPQKNPVCAGTLAAIVPGLGHAYVSRYRDATVAFLVNGLFIWAAIESFQNDQPVLGGMLTFFEVGWYSGNIYSAINTTHKHNRKVRNDFRGRLKDKLDLHLFTARKGQIGLSLTWVF